MSSRRSSGKESKGHRSSPRQSRSGESRSGTSRSGTSRSGVKPDPFRGISDEATWDGGAPNTTSAGGIPTNYNPRIAEIRAARGSETTGGKTVYIKRADGREEFLSAVTDFTGYNLNQNDWMEGTDDPVDFWQAYNEIALFILSGEIRLEGGLDSMKYLANPKPGVGVLHANSGIFYIPDKNVYTFGAIKPKHELDGLTKVTITPPVYKDKKAINKITLYRGNRYVIQ